MPQAPKSILAIDVGAKRIGISVASLAAKLPRPLITLENNDTLMPAIRDIVEVENVGLMVVGFPRGMEGQETAQTKAIEEFTAKLRENFAMPIKYQDESLTSKHAKIELESRGRVYDKGDIDSLAATYILEDFLSEKQNLLELEQ